MSSWRDKSLKWTCSRDLCDHQSLTPNRNGKRAQSKRSRLRRLQDGTKSVWPKLSPRTNYLHRPTWWLIRLCHQPTGKTYWNHCHLKMTSRTKSYHSRELQTRNSLQERSVLFLLLRRKTLNWCRSILLRICTSQLPTKIRALPQSHSPATSARSTTRTPLTSPQHFVTTRSLPNQRLKSRAQSSSKCCQNPTSKSTKQIVHRLTYCCKTGMRMTLT